MLERIRTLLESRQLTPTQFADLIGVARPIISHILSGRNKPSLDVVQRILAAMPDLSMAWLLNGTEPMLTTAREAAPAKPEPRAASPAAAPTSVMPPQSVVPAQLPAPEIAGHYEQVSVDEVYVRNVAVAEAALAAVPEPVVPGPPTAAAAPQSAAPAPVARPTNSAPSHPPMPRRFTVKPAVAEPPRSITAPEVAFAPVPLVPAAASVSVATQVAAPVTPIATAAAAVPMVESAVKDVVVSDSITNAEPFAAAGTAPGGEAVPVPGGPSGVAVATMQPVPLEAPMPAAVPTPASVPIPAAGPVPSPAPTLANDMAAALFTGAEKPIRRIVIFYRDGSFADYQPE
jgi:transcriptional regulator with XRE-family HTH domain